MGKLRFARKATKGKGKRWKKGNSSTSNPGHKKYRDSAKRGFFNTQKGSGGLTEDLLAKHNALQGRERTVSESSDASIGCKTFDTFATNFSDCSNQSFSRLMRNWQSSSALHKEMLAVLTAVAELIKEKGGKETETEYFAALMLTLETVDNDESKTAILGLLGMVIKRLPPSVLKAKFSEVAKVFVSHLGNYANSDHVALLRSLIGCLSVLLRAQEQAVWNNHSTVHVFNTVLSFSTHAKPKVRKVGQHAVCSILKGSCLSTAQFSGGQHPASAVTAKYCIKKIEESGGSGQATITLHVLGLLKEVLSCFSKEDIKSVCETLLRIMLLSSPLIKCCSLNAFSGLFKAKSKQMTADLLAQLINALYDYQPSSNDNQNLIAWISSMYYALLHLESLNKKLCLDHTVKFFCMASKSWLSDKEDVINTVTNVLKDLLLHCVAPCISHIYPSSEAELLSAAPIHKLIQCFEETLKYQFHSVWGDVLKVINVAFQVLGKQCYPLMTKCLLSLAELRETHHFSFTSDLDRAMGTAVRIMGPEFILQSVPIKIDEFRDKFDFPRSWLIPVIRDNVQETKLQFFTKFFLPLALQFRNKALDLEKQQCKVEAKTYDILQSQIWSMLPGFCTKPTDLTESFRGIAKTLGTVLNERPDLRLFILSSIRNLINKNGNNASNQKELAKYAKNFLPILFNLYTTEPDTTTENSIRLAVFDTTKVYLKITNTSLITELFDKAVFQLEDETTAKSSFHRHAIIDLYRALLPYLNEAQISRIYTYAKTHFESEDRTIQKKAYRIMEEICQNQDVHCIKAVKKNLPDLQQFLLSSLHKANPSSKAPRLRCLTYVASHLQEEDNEFTSTVIPEAILCVKESSEKARASAFNLLIELVRAEMRWNPKPADAVQLFIKKVTSGLLGTPHLMSATIMALARIYYEFKDHITSETTELLIQRVCILLTAKSREVVQSALAFMKTLFDALPSDHLVQYLPEILKGLTSSTQDCQRHFRFKVRLLMIRLVRKFGYEAILKMVPESHKKVLNNIRKTEARKAKLKTNQREDDPKDFGKPSDEIDDVLQDSDSDDNETEGNEKEIENYHTKRSVAFIQEAGEEIVDFLDQKVNQKITAVRPINKGVTGVKHTFKTAPDGRLIITDDNEDNSSKKGHDSMDYVVEAAEFAKKGQKRMRAPDSDDDEQAVYPGDRRGIHRKDPRNTQDGAMYRATKAQGDIRKKGKHEPYAYIPLDPKVLNKRKKAKISKQFSSVVRGAKKGAAKGARAKAKNGKRNLK